jgi:hypothetical protein
MKVIAGVLTILISVSAYAQEYISCDGTSLPAACVSSSGSSLFSPVLSGVGVTVPVQITNTAEKITVPDSSATAVIFKTLPASLTTNYWINLNNLSRVDFSGDFAAKTKTTSPEELAPDASSMVLTGGMINTLNLDLSGFRGQSAEPFSTKCATDIAAGAFGQGALSVFIQRRKDDPNVPKHQCDAVDLQWLESNPANPSYCPTGTSDIAQDGLVNPVFSVQRLAPKNKCQLQADTRACSINGDRFKCQLRFNQPLVGSYNDGTGIYTGLFQQVISFLPGLNFIPFFIGGVQFVPQGDNIYAYESVNSATSASGHPVSVQERIAKTNGPECTTVDPCLGAFGGCRQTIGCKPYYDEMTHYVSATVEDSAFYYPFGGDQADAISNLCASWIDPINDVTYNYASFQLKNEASSFGLVPQASINVAPATSDVLCESYAQENYNITDFPYFSENFGRNVLSITSESTLKPIRQYEYVSGDCPVGETKASNDQFHYSPSWVETLSCTSGSCAGANLFFNKINFAAQNMSMSRGQPGAERGRAAVFVYDVTTVVVTAVPGLDGSSGAVDVQIPTTIKYCASIKDLTNAIDIHDEQSLHPSVTLNEVDYKAYAVARADGTPTKAYDTASRPYVYKRIDSSVRDWIFQLTNN